LRWLLTPTVSGSNPATRTMTTFLLITLLLMLVSILIVNKTSYQEYGIAGIIIGLVLTGVFMIYLLFR
jgi:hypothetical protein